MRKSNIIKIAIAIFIIIVVIALIVLNKIGFFIHVDLDKKEYQLVNKNLYYSEKLIDQKKANQQVIIKDYKMISDFMNKKYPDVKIIVTNFNEDLYQTDKNYFVFQGYQIIDGVIIKDVSFNISTKNGVLDKDIDLVNSKSFKDLTIKKDKIISEGEVKKIAKKQIIDNKKSMPKTMGNNIKSSYDLIYKDNKLCYEVTISYNSVTIDAESGEVVDKFFFSAKQQSNNKEGQ